jgi:hypothetical protein
VFLPTTDCAAVRDHPKPNASKAITIFKAELFFVNCSQKLIEASTTSVVGLKRYGSAGDL